MRINIIIPDEELVVIDDFCNRNGYKRSAFLVLAARKLIEQELADPRLRVQKVTEKVLNRSIPDAIFGGLDKKIDSEAKRVIHEVKKKQAEKGSEVCKHGRMKGLCEYGCK